MIHNRFSIVASVFGVEKYLDEFFVSIVNQTIGFEECIELIFVDDGSTDSSAEKIKKWQQYYPENIKYFYKDNGGLSSARNAGLKLVTTSWVSFIDPDDFISETYFEEVDSFLLNQSNDQIGMISCNLIFYIEKEDRLSDSHPLSFRFRQKETILELPNLGDFFQLSVNSVLLRTDIIRKHSFQMNLQVKPTFEDAHFLGKYLLAIPGFKVVFLRDAKYYYRKRQDNTSLIDSSWEKLDQYTSKLKYGYLDLLEHAKANNDKSIPDYIQRIVLYDLIWYVKYIVNHNERISFLSVQQKNEFLSLLKEIFFNIDTDIINHFSVAGCWFYHKVGIFGAFKSIDPPHQIVYLEDYDPQTQLIKLKYFYYGSLPTECFKLDDESKSPIYAKTRIHDFINDVFVNERIIWLEISDESSLLHTEIGDVNTRLAFAGKHWHNGISTELIVKYFVKNELNDINFPISARLIRRLAKSPITIEQYKNAWLFMDRDTQADDNAEHLYRYIVKSHPEINAYFILRKNSQDWLRLMNEGFNLIEFDSRQHKLALLNAKHLISSHVDQYVVSLLRSQWFSDMQTYHYTFLQHGVTKDDLSNWLNTKSIDLFITSTQQEFSSIAGSNNRYKFSSKEVCLTGFPRHDALLRLNAQISTEKLIIIMPTWREALIGQSTDKGNNREINDDFYESEYAKTWKSLLHSNRLKQLIDSYGYSLVFFPHINIQPYLEWFETPDYISTLSHASTDSIQKLFSRASLMITDYSSVAFEMAYINKPTIYYQFDCESVFNGGHLTSKGYFDYEQDGFGPVCFELNQVINALASLLDNDALPDEYYQARMKYTFVHRDGLCCKRVYDGIRSLE